MKKNRVNNHFIPQFYLRKFSSNSNNKTIGLFNYKSPVFVREAPIKSQAKEKHFYGRDEIVENALGKLEMLVAIIIQKIIESKSVPPSTTVYYDLLVEYLLYQSARTVKAAAELNNNVSALTKHLLGKTKIDKKKYENLEFYYMDPVILAMDVSAKSIPLMSYLDLKLIINNTSYPFITSDNPVIKYNRLMEINNLDGGTLGLAWKGLQIFYPIAPGYMLYWYDGFSYQCGEEKTVSVSINNKDEIEKLNGLQVIFSDSTLYFNEKISRQYVESLLNRFITIKGKLSPYFIDYPEEILETGDISVKFLSTSNDPRIDLDLSFTKFTEAAQSFKPDDRVVYLRHDSFKDFNRPNYTQ